MSHLWKVCFMFLALFGSASAQEMPSTLTMLDGEVAESAQWKGKVQVYVNVASRCGFTSQYDGLQALWTKYKDKGLVIVGVPCNQFGSQEPGKADEIQSFCRMNYGVDFPLLEKQKVLGGDRSPLYQYLLKGRTPVLWNFEKVLVGRDGKVIDRFRSVTAPDDEKFIKAIEAALN
jgi:glutathione peroxidase-family protein